MKDEQDEQDKQDEIDEIDEIEVTGVHTPIFTLDRTKQTHFACRLT